MAIDVKSIILSVFKANTDDVKSKEKELRGLQKKASGDRGKEIEKEREGLDGLIDKYGKQVIAIGAITAGIGVLKKGFETFARDSQLQAASFGVDINQLKLATRGLIEEEKLLDLAASTLNSDFKLTQEQLNEVAKFMVVLKKEGKDTAAAFDQVKKAVVEANAEGLKEFGIVIEAQSDTLAGHGAILDAIIEKNKAFGEINLTNAEEAEASSVKMTDAFRRLEIAIGKIAVVLTPVVELIAAFVDSFSGPNEEFLAQFNIELGVHSKLIKEIVGDYNDINAEVAQFNLLLANQATFLEKLKEKFDKASKAVERLEKKEEAAAKARRKRAAALNKGKTLFDLPIAGGRSEFFEESERRIAETRAELAAQDAERARQAEQGISEIGRIDLEGIESPFAADEDNILTKVFGKPDDFNAQIEVYQTGLALMGGALEQAFDAWTTGSGSATEAMQKFLAAGLSAIAGDMRAKAFQHLAAGVGALAFGGNAAIHFKAAALYTAGSVAVGIAAKSISGSASSGGGQASASAGGGGGGRSFFSSSPTGSFAGGGGPGGTTTQNIFIGSDFAEDDRRRRGERLKRTMTDAGIETNQNQTVSLS